MRKLFVTAPAVLFATSCFLHAPSAFADTYNFTISTPAGQPNGLSASGSFTTSSSGAVQTITSLTGTAENGDLTSDYAPVTFSLIPTTPGSSTASPSVKTYDTGGGSFFYLYYDNLYTPGAATGFDLNGIGIESSNGIGYEIGSVGSGYAYEAFTNDIAFDQLTFNQNNVPLDIAITPAAAAVTPEPSSIALLGTGLLGVAGVVRRRFQA